MNDLMGLNDLISVLTNNNGKLVLKPERENLPYTFQFDSSSLSERAVNILRQHGFDQWWTLNRFMHYLYATPRSNLCE